MSACEYSFSILSQEWRYTFGVINVAVVVAALFGNLIIVILMLKIRSFRNRSNMILGSLAATDLLVGFLVAPMYVLQFLSAAFRENCSLTNARRVLSVLLVGSSSSLIALISYDRYIHLSKTQNYAQYMTRRKIGFFISLCWIVPALIPFTRIAAKDEVFNAVAVFAFILAILVTMLVSYLQVMKLLREKEKLMAQYKQEYQMQARQLNAHQSEENQSQTESQLRMSKRRIQAANMVIIVIICYAVCFIPGALHMGLVAIDAFVPGGIPTFQGTVKEASYAVVMTLTMVNSGINPVIYSLKHPGFREKLRKMFRGMISPISSRLEANGSV